MSKDLTVSLSYYLPMYKVGFDSITLTKALPSMAEALLQEETREPKPFKAFLAASVTTKDDKFPQLYQEELQVIFKRFGIPQLKPLYKGAHLVKQADEKSAQVICALLEAVEPMVSHIDLYCAYYRQNTISVFGEAQGQRLQPLTFIEKNQNSFAHIAAWFWCKTYSYKEGYTLLLDHFEGKLTPAWRELEKAVPGKIKVYYSGSECNSLISLADLVLKLVETFHRLWFLACWICVGENAHTM